MLWSPGAAPDGAGGTVSSIPPGEKRARRRPAAEDVPAEEEREHDEEDESEPAAALAHRDRKAAPTEPPLDWPRRSSMSPWPWTFFHRTAVSLPADRTSRHALRRRPDFGQRPARPGERRRVPALERLQRHAAARGVDEPAVADVDARVPDLPRLRLRAAASRRRATSPGSSEARSMRSAFGTSPLIAYVVRPCSTAASGGAPGTARA